jgi:hypothetical protein
VTELKPIEFPVGDRPAKVPDSTPDDSTALKRQEM